MTDAVVLDVVMIPTRDGEICLYAKKGALLERDNRPVLLMIHGALRNSSVLFEWVNLCGDEFDVVFVDLPGHGRSSSPATATIEGIATSVGDAITAALGKREIVVVGESLGGLVALALGGLQLQPIRGIIAADPPLTMSKLWHVRRAMSDAVAGTPDNQFLKSLALNVFGVGADEAAHERIYYDLVEKIHVPVLILTGDVPLFPVRSCNAVPCLIDDVDRHVVGRLAANKVEFKTVADCGHVLLVEAGEQCRKMVGEFFHRGRLG